MTWRQIVSDLTPKMENRVSIGNLLTILTGIIALLGTVFTLQSDIRALAQRVSDGEKRDDKTSETLDTMKGTIIELKGDMKATKSDMERQGRQLDRIENILRALPQTQPQPQHPRNP